MDDLVGGALLLAVAAVVIGTLIAVAVAMAAVGAVVGSLIVGVRGTVDFLRSLGRRVVSRGAADRVPLAPEPAFELYALGQLRRDLRSSIEDAWEGMQDGRRMTDGFAARCNGMFTPLGFGATLGGLLGTFFGGIVSVVLSLPVLIASVIIMAGAWALIGLLRAAEAVRRRVRRAGYECPVDHERFALPVYVCPACGAEHHRLVPGRWGVLRRECECGRASLPTMVLNGRQRVPQRCPSGHPLDGLIGYAEIVRLALVAGPSGGKTTFLAGALLELERLSAGGTLAVGVLDQSRGEYDAALRTLRDGRLPQKTQLGRTPALVAEVQGGGRSRVLSLYDVAGESYGGVEAILDLRFLEVPSGLILLIDPTALERLAVDREQELAAVKDRVGTSPMSPMRVLERTLGALDAAGAATERLPLAVVVAKADALGIGDEIRALEATAGERAVPEWLERNGGGSIVRAVETSFRSVGWFHASALGRVPDPADRRPFAPEGTAAPLLWLLQQKGIVPAAKPFLPAQAADRLKSTGAQDFPPIGRLGWTLRAGSAALATLAVMAGIGIGVATGVRAIPAGAEPAGAAATGTLEEPRAKPSTRTFARAQFALTLPRRWVPIVRDRRHDGYLRNGWRPRGDRRTRIYVDYTRRIKAPARVSARRVRAIVRRNRSYREISFRRVTLGERRAWRWEFRLGGLRKVDYFVNACGTGYAVLGSTTARRWARYKSDFSRAARSLEPPC